MQIGFASMFAKLFAPRAEAGAETGSAAASGASLFSRLFQAASSRSGGAATDSQTSAANAFGGSLFGAGPEPGTSDPRSLLGEGAGVTAGRSQPAADNLTAAQPWLVETPPFAGPGDDTDPALVPLPFDGTPFPVGGDWPSPGEEAPASLTDIVTSAPQPMSPDGWVQPQTSSLDPGGSTPVVPGTPLPVDPGGLTPVVPGTPSPINPGGLTPTVPGMSSPVDPGGLTPTVPGMSSPVDPGGLTPTVPGAPSPVNPGGLTPTVPGTSSPVDPGGLTPTVPGAATPVNPGGLTPTVPGVPTLDNPGGLTPTVPVAAMPVDAGGSSPTLPGAATPTGPAQPTLVDPGGPTLADSARPTLVDPSGRTSFGVESPTPDAGGGTDWSPVAPSPVKTPRLDAATGQAQERAATVARPQPAPDPSGVGVPRTEAAAAIEALDKMIEPSTLRTTPATPGGAGRPSVESGRPQPQPLPAPAEPVPEPWPGQEAGDARIPSLARHRPTGPALATKDATGSERSTVAGPSITPVRDFRSRRAMRVADAGSPLPAFRQATGATLATGEAGPIGLESKIGAAEPAAVQKAGAVDPQQFQLQDEPRSQSTKVVAATQQAAGVARRSEPESGKSIDPVQSGGVVTTGRSSAVDPSALPRQAGPVRHEAMLHAIMARAQTMQRPGNVELRFALAPPGLGNVRVKIQATGDQLRVELIAGSTPAAELLGQGLSRLTSQLNQAGFSQAEVTLGMEANADPSTHGGQQREPGGQAGSNPRASGRPARQPDETPEQLAGDRNQQGRLDRTA